MIKIGDTPKPVNREIGKTQIIFGGLMAKKKKAKKGKPTPVIVKPKPKGKK
jgi:hypothetical protein